MEIENEELIQRLQELQFVAEMTSSIANKVLRRKTKDANVCIWNESVACKLFGLLWLRSKGCSLSIPKDFAEYDMFPATFLGKELVFTATIYPVGVSFTLVYLGGTKAISKSHFERIETLPNLTNVTIEQSDEKSAYIHSLNEVTFSFESEFYRPILHPIYKGMEPRSTSVSPKRAHSRR